MRYRSLLRGATHVDISALGLGLEGRAVGVAVKPPDESSRRLETAAQLLLEYPIAGLYRRRRTVAVTEYVPACPSLR